MSGKQAPQGPALLELSEVDTARPVGRVEAATRRAVHAAGLQAADEGAAEAAAALSRGMDLAVGRGDPYAVAAIGKPLMEQLARLGLDPEARGDGAAVAGDPWDELLDEIRDELGTGGQRDSHHPGTSAS
jgi:hypothetical protein